MDHPGGVKVLQTLLDLSLKHELGFLDSFHAPISCVAVPTCLIPGLAFLLFFLLPFGDKRWTEGSVCYGGRGELSDALLASCHGSPGLLEVGVLRDGMCSPWGRSVQALCLGFSSPAEVVGAEAR